jgi:hypothetical protein
MAVIIVRALASFFLVVLMDESNSSVKNTLQQVANRAQWTTLGQQGDNERHAEFVVRSTPASSSGSLTRCSRTRNNALTF